MAIASLTKFTVPLATDQSASTQGLLMPKLKYRFRAVFENFGVSSEKTELTKQVADIKRPNLNFNPFTIDVYNSKVNLIGKPSWETITVTLRDDAGGNVSKLVGEQVQKQFDFAEQASASSGIDYKFLLRYEMLDGGNGANQPNILETWEIYGAFISQVDYGELSYSDGNAPVTIALTITYDNAVQTPSGVGIGTAVGRTLGTIVTG
ncbi:hypothetical protein UFOVP257_33 [uncultured Caudovirales phage]|uniref:Tail tube protein n=1 Tax=uncultured Caudovirales phage TaxID=2100421 RepID=A0A6J5LEB2_9CAUD|nr:hypothetical protein UFOVP257_33 [uncultured Caudovirales phage]